MAGWVLWSLVVASILGILSCGRTSLAAAAGGPAGGLNVEPSMRPWRYIGANPQSWWCVQPNCTSDFSDPVATAKAEMTEAKAVGAINVRLEVPWPVIEVARGAYDWSRADSLFQAAAQVGLSIDPILMWTPQWAGGGPALNAPPTPTDMQSFAQAFAERYDAQVRSGIEVWNEPDNGNYLNNGSASTYVSQILNPAYAGIKAVDSAIPVILGGPVNDAGSCCPFLSAVIAAGGHFNIASFHNYSGGAIGEAQAYRSIVGGGVPIWLGEYGVQSNQGDQSGAISQVLGSSSALAVAQWYNLRDTASWTCCPPANVDQGHWGLLNSDFTGKPSWTTMESALTGRTAPPPVPNLNSSSATGSSVSSSGSTGPAAAQQAGSQAPASAAAPGPQSAIASDPAARARVTTDRFDPPFYPQRALGVALDRTPLWRRPWIIGAAILGLAAVGVVSMVFARRAPRHRSAEPSTRAKRLDPS